MADWKGSDTFFLVAGVVQAILALGAFLFLAAWVFAGAAYLGVGPGAAPALLFMLYGFVAAILLAVRRTTAASRLASLWYLPMSLFFLAFAFFHVGDKRWPRPEQIYSFFGGLALLLIFVILVKPVVPGRTPGDAVFQGKESR
jgi:hypothetical protein